MSPVRVSVCDNISPFVCVTEESCVYVCLLTEFREDWKKMMTMMMMSLEDRRRW